MCSGGRKLFCSQKSTVVDDDITLIISIILDQAPKPICCVIHCVLLGGDGASAEVSWIYAQWEYLNRNWNGSRSAVRSLSKRSVRLSCERQPRNHNCTTSYLIVMITFLLIPWRSSSVKMIIDLLMLPQATCYTLAVMSIDHYLDVILCILIWIDHYRPYRGMLNRTRAQLFFREKEQLHASEGISSGNVSRILRKKWPHQKGISIRKYLFVFLASRPRSH